MKEREREKSKLKRTKITNFFTIIIYYYKMMINEFISK